MKKVALLFLALCLTLSLTACSGRTKEVVQVAPDKVLVAYFSCSGNTQKLAEDIADALHCDLYEIVAEDPYTDEELERSDDDCRTQQELKDPNARPAIVGTVEGMEDYEVIFIGYPIWWGDAPKIIATFLERYDFSNKTIIPFCTSGSSGLGASATNLHGYAAKSARWLEGMRFPSSTARRAVTEWLNELPIKVSAE